MEPNKFLMSKTQLITYPLTYREFNLCDRIGKPYPGILDRLQIMSAENRHSMLIRHLQSYHWCGYVLIPYAEWQRLEVYLRNYTPSAITYAAYSGKFVTWMGPTMKENKLTVPMHLSDDPEGDFWIGFDQLYEFNKKTVESPVDDKAALEQLVEFETFIWGARNGDLSLGR